MYISAQFNLKIIEYSIHVDSGNILVHTFINKNDQIVNISDLLPRES